MSKAHSGKGETVGVTKESREKQSLNGQMEGSWEQGAEWRHPGEQGSSPVGEIVGEVWRENNREHRGRSRNGTKKVTEMPKREDRIT